jgi:hypothetical protein
MNVENKGKLDVKVTVIKKVKSEEPKETKATKKE